MQRTRLIGAVMTAVELRGYTGLTVGGVVAASHISRKTFYDLFANIEDAFLAAVDQAVDHARAIAGEAYSREAGWRAGTRAALFSLLSLMDERRGLARMCIVETLTGGSRVIERRAEVLEEISRALDRGREHATTSYEPPSLTAPATAGAIAAIIHTRLRGTSDAPLTDLLGSLMSMIVLPHMGSAAAHRELVAPVPVPPPPTLEPQLSRPEANLLTDLHMRVTYRTVRVLMAIADNPGASNQEIALTAAIADQGQVSKLLARLLRLGLLEKAASEPAIRATNAWCLTELGDRVYRATRGVTLGL